MSFSRLEAITRGGLVHFIQTYQKHLSPYKKFSCPHRVLQGGVSCSEYVKVSLLHQDLSSVLRLSSQRFKDCAAAGQTLQTQVNQVRGGCIVIPCCIPIPI